MTVSLSLTSEARMDPTAGLHVSHPSPLPYLARILSKELTESMSGSVLMRAMSSGREYGKCSHMWLERDPPSFSSSWARICFTCGSQPPHPEPALVHFFRTGKVAPSTPSSWTAAAIVPRVTSLQEQIWALGSSDTSSSSAGPVRAVGGASRVAGFSGSSPSVW